MVRRIKRTTQQRLRYWISGKEFILKLRAAWVHTTPLRHPLEWRNQCIKYEAPDGITQCLVWVSESITWNLTGSDPCFLLHLVFLAYLFTEQKAALEVNACISHWNTGFSFTSCQLALQTGHLATNNTFGLNHSFNPVCYRRWLNTEQQLLERHWISDKCTSKQCSKVSLSSGAIFYYYLHTQKGVPRCVSLSCLENTETSKIINQKNNLMQERWYLKNWLNQAVIPWRLTRKWIVSNLPYATSLSWKPSHSRSSKYYHTHFLLLLHKLVMARHSSWILRAVHSTR